jgi:hypothetical protein
MAVCLAFGAVGMRRSYFEHVQLKAGVLPATPGIGHDGYEMQMDAATDSVVITFSSDFLEELTDRIKCEASGSMTLPH